MGQVRRKAGIIVFGRMNGCDVVVAPYALGRIEDDLREYTLAKGGMNAGEDRSSAADREFFEETGIPMATLCQYPPNHPKRMDNGHDAFSKARVIRRIPLEPQTYSMIAVDGKATPVEMNLDVVIVDNISGLLAHCKTPKTSGEPLEFMQSLAWLHENGFPASIGTRESFDAFMADPAHQQQYLPLFKRYRTTLEGQHIIGDNEGWKMDDRDHFLRFFQEGAEIMPVEDYFRKIRMLAERFNPASQDFMHSQVLKRYHTNQLGPDGSSGQLEIAKSAYERVRPLLSTVDLETDSVLMHNR